jgi:phosphoribosyl 1,2-cyclic phosphate phosphodiesterase
MLQITVLGSGTSHGVPMIGCLCRVCTSTDPHDKRTRPSIVVGIGERNILIDTSPELRLQLVANHILHIDSVLYTHGHADHVHGVDDLRRFNERIGGPVPVYGEPDLLEDLKRRFPYIFTHQFVGGGIPSLELRGIDGPFDLYGQHIVPVRVWHGMTPVLGFRFGRFAYVTDTSSIPEQSMALLRGLDVLILDALRIEPHPTHFNFAQALEVVKLLRPKQTYFTHLTHTTLHAKPEPPLPPGVFLAYDGLRLEID